MKKLFAQVILLLCITIQFPILAQDDVELNRLKKLCNEFELYKRGSIPHPPESIHIVAKSNLEYATKIIDGSIGDVELTENEKTEVLNQLKTKFEEQISMEPPLARESLRVTN